MLSPIVDDIAKEFEGKIEVAKCNIDDAEEVMRNMAFAASPPFSSLKTGRWRTKPLAL